MIIYIKLSVKKKRFPKGWSLEQEGKKGEREGQRERENEQKNRTES